VSWRVTITTVDRAHSQHRVDVGGRFTKASLVAVDDRTDTARGDDGVKLGTRGFERRNQNA
jgi:hypothetical protein